MMKKKINNESEYFVSFSFFCWFIQWLMYYAHMCAYFARETRNMNDFRVLTKYEKREPINICKKKLMLNYFNTFFF